MKTTKRKILTMAIVRGGHPRMAEAHFYSHFQKFKLKLVGDSRTGWINHKNLSNKVEFVNTSLYPAWGIDPWTLFFGTRYVHRSFQFLKNLEKIVADCEVVNISDLFYFYCWQSAILANKLNKKLVAIVWENVPRHASTYLPPYSLGVRRVLKTADLFIARSRKAKDYLLSIGADAAKIKVIYKGINLNRFKSFKEKRRNGGKVKILYVGQLVKSKGVLELMIAFERLCSEFTNLELWLVGRSGKDPLGRLVDDYTRRLPIVLKADVDYDAMPEVYNNADIYCHLSQDWKYLGLLKGGNDWFPYAVIEAMASSLPVVATRVGGIPEQLGEVGNIYVKQKNIDSVYRGLKKIILDKRLRENLGRLNRERAEEMFDIKVQAQKTEQAILKII